MDLDALVFEAQKVRLEDGDSLKAEELLLKAAQVGSGHAAHELGVMYITGEKEVKKNKEKAIFWLEKSLASGFEASIATDPEWFREK